MYIIYRNIWSKNQALYNIKKSINNKNSNHCVNNDFTNTFLTAQMRSLDSRRQVQSFKSSHYQSGPDIKKKTS